MTGIYQLADLTIEVEGSIEELVDVQGVEREFSRACRKIRKAAGEEDVQILLDKDLESDEGRKFSKIRLRAYANGKNYTIDCGSTEDNILGVYVPWDAPVEVYDRESETVEEAHPLESSAASTSQEAAEEPQSAQDEAGGDAQAPGPDSPPEPDTGENGKIADSAALQLWNAAKRAGHNKKSFSKMLASVAGIKNPKLLHVDDWPQAWAYAVAPGEWKIDEHVEEERELPLN
jgi:hypothetical protein